MYALSMGEFAGCAKATHNDAVPVADILQTLGKPDFSDPGIYDLKTLSAHRQNTEIRKFCSTGESLIEIPFRTRHFPSNYPTSQWIP
jgi:hypothetical protein